MRRAYVLWQEDLGFCEGFLSLTQKRIRDEAIRRFKKSWQDMRSSGYRVREVAICPPLKNGWPMVGDQLVEWKTKQALRAIKRVSKRSPK